MARHDGGPFRKIAVIDIGKTNAKLALVDLAAQREIAVLSTPNTVLAAPPYPHFDIERLWRFILTSLGELYAAHGFDAISITTHGATLAVLDRDGQLAMAVMDYEFEYPPEIADAYASIRPPFDETGSPRLPGGLNAGAQLHYQQTCFPDDFARIAAIVPYPQYWARRLTGVVASETTSLGTHTDLWDPDKRAYSSLVEKCGWRHLMPEIKPAFAILGPVLPEVAEIAKLPADLPVFCGIHDSNASLLPYILSSKPPFSVVSTGTWVICMAVGGSRTALAEQRDTLINVNALGDPVPSGRFMGGRAFSQLTGKGDSVIGPADRNQVLAEQIMYLPSLPHGSGPFPDKIGRWSGDPSMLSDGGRLFAVSLYLAMMTATSLELIGAEGPTMVEGPFAANPAYLEMLASMTARQVCAGGSGLTGTSLGAACLAMDSGSKLDLRPLAQDFEPDPALQRYWREWLVRAEA